MSTHTRYFLLSFLLALFTQEETLHADAAYAQLSSLATQTPEATGTSIVKMDSIDAMRNIDISPDKTKLIIKESGVYFFVAAAQVAATNPGARGYVDIWLIKNGANVPNSNTRMSVDTPSSTNVLVCQAVLSLSADDIIAVGYSASGPSLGIKLTQPDNEPAIPSIILSILKIDTGPIKP